MAQIPNTKALTVGDGASDYFNIDTQNKIVQLGNGAKLAFYSDTFTTLAGQIINGDPAPAVSSSAQALATSGTITTSGVGAARENPGSAVTAVVLGTGTVDGQECWVINEAAASNSIQFAASATSN